MIAVVFGAYIGIALASIPFLLAAAAAGCRYYDRRNHR